VAGASGHAVENHRRCAFRHSLLSGISVKKTHHRGLEPRLSIPATPPECVAQFSICFLDGEETTIVPFVDFGHHIVRLRFSKEEGVTLLVDYESLKVAGPRGGKIEIDDLTIWTVKEEVAYGWEKEREQLPKFEVLQVREKPKK